MIAPSAGIIELTSRSITVRKHELAIKLQSIEPHPRPKVALEQYTIPADLAAEILFRACYEFNDIEGKSVVDLGTGTGRLALAASMLGADYVVGAELDPLALEIAAKSSNRLQLEIDWVLADIETLRGTVDTVVMNPPFGTKQLHADIRFLDVAIRIAKVAYSIHKTSTREYLKRWFREHGRTAELLSSTEMIIPYQFPFHRKRRRLAYVDVFRIARR